MQNKPSDSKQSPAARKRRRFQVNWSVMVVGRDTTGASFIEMTVLENISSRGAYLYIEKLVEVGAIIDLLIKLPLKSDRWMKYSGEVVRTEDSSAGVGTAMEFKHFRPEFVSSSAIVKSKKDQLPLSPGLSLRFRA